LEKAMILKALIIAILVYYLMKGILYLVLWQVLAKIEERGKERAEKARNIVMEQRRLRDEREAELLKDQDNKRRFY